MTGARATCSETLNPLILSKIDSFNFPLMSVAFEDVEMGAIGAHAIAEEQGLLQVIKIAKRYFQSKSFLKAQ